MHLLRAERGTFAGPARFLADGGNRARIGTYLADMTRPYGADLTPDVLDTPRGHSYGEMASALLEAVVPAAEPVDLLVLAFSIHDMWPGRATAAYLSHLCPGTPMSFAVCDQGSAAAFSGLRIAREYLGVAGCRRALLIVVEHAVLPYDSVATAPAQHRGVALLCGRGDGHGDGDGDGDAHHPMVTAIRQHAGVPADAVAELLTSDLADLSAGHRAVRVVLGDALATAWCGHPQEGIAVVAPGQPATGVWWHLVDELATGRADLVVAADYDPDLRYLCLTALAPAR